MKINNSNRLDLISNDGKIKILIKENDDKVDDNIIIELDNLYVKVLKMKYFNHYKILIYKSEYAYKKAKKLWSELYKNNPNFSVLEEI